MNRKSVMSNLKPGCVCVYVYVCDFAERQKREELQIANITLISDSISTH